MAILEIIFWVNIVIFFYVVVGYPLLSFLLGKIFSYTPKTNDQYFPSVTLIISAYNEEQDIRKKLENALYLSYPKNKLEILVISDASTDSTDTIVREFAGEGVKLHRMEQRGGKTAGLNAVVPNVQGEIVVFSDANAYFRHDAILKLVRNFSDPEIGCVTGDSQYVDIQKSSSGWNENLYWVYDRWLKISESRCGSMVGSDGAIFAIRKSDYSQLGPEDINDFILPLQIVNKGLRCVLEKEAICEEASIKDSTQEFYRKVRVVNRSWNGIWKMKEFLNPIAHGWFAIQLWSHKVLRWLTPVFLLFIFCTSLALASHSDFFRFLLVGQLLIFGLGLLGWVMVPLGRSHWLISACSYFMMINMASIAGVGQSFLGQSIIVWDPIRTSSESGKAESKSLTSQLGFLFTGVLLMTGIWFFPIWSFGIGLLLLFHVYVGYPLSLFILGRFKDTPWVQSPITPSVTLLLVVYNEEEVLRQKLDNCLALEYPKEQLSILVCSDGSTDRTNEILSEYQDRLSTICFPERSGKIRVIEKAFPKIRSDITIFSDANTFLEKDVIKKLTRNFADDSIGAVSGEVTLVSKAAVHGKPESLYYRYEWQLQKLESQIYSQIGVDGALYAIRTNCFPKQVPKLVNDDLYIGLQVALRGKRVISEHEARGLEASEETLHSEFYRRVRITSLGITSFLDFNLWPKWSQPFLLYQLVSHKILRWLAPFFMAALFLSSLLLMDVPIFREAFFIQIFFYGYAAFGLVMRSASIWMALPTYFCLVNLASLIGVLKGFLFEQAGTWERVGLRRWASE